MKTLSEKFLILFFLIGISGCLSSAPEKNIGEQLNWSFIESVGGMRVGDPVKRDRNSWVLPVKCDISGMFEISVKPVQLNTALALKSLHGKIEGKIIYLRVETESAGGKFFQTTSYGLKFNKMKNGKGKYAVKYLNQDNTSVFLKDVIFR